MHVDSSFALLNTIAGYKPGQALQLQVLRAGKKIELTAEVAERPQSRI
jgi:S1-C subfamily serine protease